MASSTQINPGNHNESLAQKKWSMNEFSNKEFIGQGGFGKVYKVDCIPHNSKYVLKYISLWKLKQKNTNLNEVLVESKILKSTRHMNLIQGFGEIVTKSNCVFIMEYLDLGDLSKFLKTRPPTTQTQKQLDWVGKTLTRQIISGVNYLHSHLNYIHMDLKPENIMLYGRYKIKITDFGCSVVRVSARKLHTYEEWKGGTTAFSPPEIIIRPFQKFDSTADVWAIGCIIYILLTKFNPFFCEDDLTTDKNTYIKNALKKMSNVYNNPTNPHDSHTFFDKIKDNPPATKLLKKIFVPRHKRVLINELDKLDWLKSNYC